MLLLRQCLTNIKLPLMPGVHGFTDYDDVESEVESNRDSSDPGPIPDCEGIGIHGWSGIALIARHDDGSIFADVIIVNVDPNACIDEQRVLGEHNVGIVVLQVENGDVALKDTLLAG